jgi:hypothetical protein
MTPGEPNRRQRIQRRVLLGPDVVCRAAAGRVEASEERWMLVQPRRVRETYVSEVLDRTGDPDVLTEVWMLRQAKAVRESYIREVLKPALSRGAPD